MAYNAFISYSHTADAAFASALQTALDRFAKPWYKLRALHIFRDQTNLAVNPGLWSSIRDALDQSLFLILLASPEAAASPWVAKEAEYWVGRNGTSHLLLVLTGGTLQWDRSAGCFTPEHTNALPQNLLRCFPEEPLFLDARWAREHGVRLRMHEPRFHEAVLQLASTLHNRPKDELDGADIRARRHARLLTASGLIAILLIAILALRQTRISRREATQNFAATLAAGSAKVLNDSPDRVGEAALLAIESNRLYPSFEANQALRAAVSLVPAGAQFYSPQDSNPAERVRDMAFSPDGATLAVARDDGSTQLINLLKRKPIGYFTPDAQPAAQVEFTKDLQNASSDNNAAVSVAFNPGGTLIASGSRDGFVHIWAISDGREVMRAANGAPVSQVAFHPNANRILIAGDDGHDRIVDLDRKAVVGDFQCGDKVASAAFSHDGNVVAALSVDGTVLLFDIRLGRLVHKLPGGEAGFNLAFSQDDKRLVAATGDFAIVWDAESGRELLKATHAALSEPLTPQQWIVDAALSPDGKFLAYAARGDKLVRVWSVDTGRQILTLKHNSAAAAVAFNTDGTKLGTGSYDGTARVWELPSGNELQRTSHSGGAEVVNFSPDGRQFAAGGIDGSVSVTQMSRADRPTYVNAPNDIRSAAFSPDGKHFAIGTTSLHASPLVRIAGLDGKILCDIEFHGAPVIDKLFFIDANHVMAQWSDRLFLIDAGHSTVSTLPELHGDWRIDPSGKMLAIQRDRVIQLYTLPAFQTVASLAGPSSSLLRTADEGRLFAFEMNQPPNDFSVDIWRVASKGSISRIHLPAEPTRIAFNSSGSILFTAENENLQVWDIPSGKQRFSLKTTDDIDAIIPSLPSTAFATLSHGHLTVWDAMNGARLAELPDTGYLRAAAFSPDGRYLLAGYDERFAALWLWRADDLRDQACGRLKQNLSRSEWSRWFPKQPYRPICPNLPPAN